MKSVSFVLPALNEAENIGSAITQAAAALCELVNADVLSAWEIIVVDDGSTDATAAIVTDLGERDARIRLVQHSSNQGYGAALRSGFRATSRDLVFFTDADLQFDVTEIRSLISWSDTYDIVAGFRSPRQDPLMRRFNAWAWGQVIRGVFELQVRDVNCAFKLFHRRVLDQLPIYSTGAFVNAEILVRAQDAGFTLKQVPVTHFPRSAGAQTGANPRVVLRAFRELSNFYRSMSAVETPRVWSARATSLASTTR